jgi:hypothetical protein
MRSASIQSEATDWGAGVLLRRQIKRKQNMAEFQLSCAVATAADVEAFNALPA